VAEAVDVEGFANVAQHEEALHFDLCAAGADGAGDVVQEAEVAGADVCDIWVAVDGAAIEALDVEGVAGHVEGVAGGFGLNPDFAVFADVAEGVGFGVDDGDLGADGNHAGVLHQEGKGFGIGVDGEDEAAAEGLRVEVQLDGFDAHVGPGGDHGVYDVGVYRVDGGAIKTALGEVYSHFLVWRGNLVPCNS